MLDEICRDMQLGLSKSSLTVQKINKLANSVRIEPRCWSKKKWKPFQIRNFHLSLFSGGLTSFIFYLIHTFRNACVAPSSVNSVHVRQNFTQKKLQIFERHWHLSDHHFPDNSHLGIDYTGRTVAHATRLHLIDGLQSLTFIDLPGPSTTLLRLDYHLYITYVILSSSILGSNATPLPFFRNLRRRYKYTPGM